jgi:hypothetical protein
MSQLTVFPSDTTRLRGIGADILILYQPSFEEILFEHRAVYWQSLVDDSRYCSEEEFEEYYLPLLPVVFQNRIPPAA